MSFILTLSGYWRLFPRMPSSRDIKLTTHLLEMTRLKIGGTVFPLSPYAFVVHKANIILYFTYLKLHASQSFLRRKKSLRKSLNDSSFMEFEFLLLCSKENATGLYTEPYEMQFTLPPYSFDSNFSIVLPLRFRYIKLRLQVFWPKLCMSILSLLCALFLFKLFRVYSRLSHSWASFHSPPHYVLVAPSGSSNLIGSSTFPGNQSPPTSPISYLIHLFLSSFTLEDGKHRPSRNVGNHMMNKSQKGRNTNNKFIHTDSFRHEQ